jgi:hypothetical protein
MFIRFCRSAEGAQGRAQPGAWLKNLKKTFFSEEKNQKTFPGCFAREAVSARGIPTLECLWRWKLRVRSTREKFFASFF